MGSHSLQGHSHRLDEKPEQEAREEEIARRRENRLGEIILG